MTCKPRENVFRLLLSSDTAVSNRLRKRTVVSNRPTPPRQTIEAFQQEPNRSWYRTSHTALECSASPRSCTLFSTLSIKLPLPLFPPSPPDCAKSAPERCSEFPDAFCVPAEVYKTLAQPSTHRKHSPPTTRTRLVVMKEGGGARVMRYVDIPSQLHCSGLHRCLNRTLRLWRKELQGRCRCLGRTWCRG